MKYLSEFNMIKEDIFPKEISILDFLDWDGDNPGNISLPGDRIINFSKNDINRILLLKDRLLKNGYDISCDSSNIHIMDRDPNRISINTNLYNFGINQEKTKAIYCGNYDDIWIYKLYDDWFLISLQRSNIIPYHKNLHYFRNSGFKFFKCDQIEEIIIFLENLCEKKYTL